jgi:broad specificity phosphatase PhoE
MSELLIIRHGESQGNTGVTLNLDTSLTENGMVQVCRTGIWIYNNLKLDGYIGYVSPYMRTLQTASNLSEITGVEFTVEESIREFRFIKNSDVIVPNRSLEFQNIYWPRQWLDYSEKVYSNESVEDFIDRSMNFILGLHPDGKYMIVTHGSPFAMLCKVTVGKSRIELEEECRKTTELLQPQNAKKFLDATPTEQALFFGGIKNCALSLLLENQPVFYNRVVYED